MSVELNPALEALLERKLADVAANMEARYGPALREYVWNGVYDPILAEIGYNGREYPASEFTGLSKLVGDT